MLAFENIWEVRGRRVGLPREVVSRKIGGGERNYIFYTKYLFFVRSQDKKKVPGSKVIYLLYVSTIH